MATLSSFNSLWEVSFALNATFIFFDYLKHKENQLNKILKIGEEELKYHYTETKESIGGWSYLNAVNKWFPIKCYIETQTLKFFGIINTFISMLLLALSAFFPEVDFWFIFSLPLLLLLLGPIAYNIFKIHYMYPKAIISSIEDILLKRLKENMVSMDIESSENEKKKIERVMFDIKLKFRYLYFPGPKIPESYFDDLKQKIVPN